LPYRFYSIIIESIKRVKIALRAHFSLFFVRDSHNHVESESAGLRGLGRPPEIRILLTLYDVALYKKSTRKQRDDNPQPIPKHSPTEPAAPTSHQNQSGAKSSNFRFSVEVFMN
jgi:hypothetical protein